MQEWQKKLSSLSTLPLPWDPTPPKEEKPNISNNIKQEAARALPSNGNYAHQPPPQSTLNTLPPIKSELLPPQYPQHQHPQQYANLPQNLPIPQGRPIGEAQQRAALALQNRFGERAGQQVASLSGNSVPPLQQGSPYIKDEPGAVQHYGQQPHAPLKTDQTDGAADDLDTWQVEYARRKALITKSREQNDSLIRDHVMASQQQLEGGGLLLPLDELPQIGARAKRRVDAVRGKVDDSGPSISRAQGDMAGDDDDEEDEDAINSDLDDPDEAELNADGEEEASKVMLCTYDKVQRVKNKWKCTLKDGILRIEGTE